MALTLSTQRASTSFLSNESAPRWRYDVFLSFRGVDTRKGFVSHLYHELCKCQGITTFFDDQELERGTSIPPELLSAIKASHTAIVVLSPNYASSKWCLDELRNIVECMEARKSILPVFYETNPSDIGNQRASFAKAFTEHEEKFISTKEKTKVTQWRADLKKVSKISGWHSKNFESDRQLIDDIVKCVRRKVQATCTLLDSSQKLVGTDSALEQLSLLLAHDANDVRFIGITGMGGVGKTTLAKLVYDEIFHHFEVHCFLENVREVSERERTLVRFQKQWGIVYTKKCLCNKKVLLVDQIKQLQALAGKKDWFGMGSRIIITTRNERLLVEHGINLCHNVKVLKDAEALKLFSLHAFRKDQPEKDFLELSKYFINHAGGLPLALQILGSALFKRGLDAWSSERHNLSKIPKPEIFDQLKISYDGLEEMQKSIFLDVACFHKGKYTEQVIEILDNSNSFGISSLIVIYVLIEKSLLYQDHYNRIWMHDLIQEMAWKIVGDESKEPGLRSRLWLYEDIIRVFTTNTGTGAIEAISLRLPKVEEVRQWNWQAFSKLHGLRILEFDNLIFSSCPEFLPCSLRTINWSFYPSEFLPTNSQLRFLTQLKMYGSKLVRLWEGKMDLPNLKYIDLSDSKKLMSTPDFSSVPNLEMLKLEYCENLVEIHPSIAVLKRLKSLCLDGCKSIKSLPSAFEMDSLEVLSLNDCYNLKKIPEFGEQMKNLWRLNLSGSAIEEIPSSIGHLVGLLTFCLDNCKKLKKIPEFGEQMKNLWKLNLSGSAIEEIPSSIGHLVGLTELHLDNCKNLKKIPEFGEQMNLWRLNLSGSAIEEIPSSIGHLVDLLTFCLDNCKNLKKVPEFGEQMKNLWRLNLSGSAIEEIPSSIGHLVGLQTFCLDNCKNLKKIPEFGEQMKNLWKLNLSGSAIEEIPSSIGHLVGLQTFCLDNCKNLKKIPEFGEQMKNLWRLNLSGSAIEEIPSSIGHLVGLTELHLDNCKNLKKIPEFGEQMKNLCKLNLSGSAIEEIPSSIGHLVGLKELHLDNCKNLKKIPEFGEQMKNLWKLNLSGSAIEEIPSSIGHLVGLKELHLDNCTNLKKIQEFGDQMKNLESIDLSGSAIEEIPSSIGHMVGLEELHLDNCKNRFSNPPRWGLVLSSLTRLCSLRELYLRDCELYEGDIPDDIGCLSFLEGLALNGNNFVSLPESIRCLSKLWCLDLDGCKSLQELPPLPSERSLWVNVCNCTSLKRLDPSKMMRRYTRADGKKSFCYDFNCLNNIALAQDEGWINTILSTILKSATEFDLLHSEIVIPGSEIPGWFSNQSVGHSVNVDLPPPSCTDWLGIAFCVVFQEPKQNLANPTAPPHCDVFSIDTDFCNFRVSYTIGSLRSEHLWVFCVDRSGCLHQEQFLFETYFGEFGERVVKAESNAVKKCGARLLYKQDLEELNQTLKILK